MAGKAKPAPSFSAFLWIGAVHSAAALPVMNHAHARADHRNDARGIGGSGRPEEQGGEDSLDQNRQRALARGLALGHRAPVGAGGQVSRVAQPDEAFTSGPGGCRDLGSHPGRIAAGQDDRKAHGSRMKAAARSSSR